MGKMTPDEQDVVLVLTLSSNVMYTYSYPTPGAEHPSQGASRRKYPTQLSLSGLWKVNLGCVIIVIVSSRRCSSLYSFIIYLLQDGPC